mgnify:CR=1 FL=1
MLGIGGGGDAVLVSVAEFEGEPHDVMQKVGVDQHVEADGQFFGFPSDHGAADFVVTGCGTGMGSMLACNSMPGVFCGLVIDPTDAFLFAQGPASGLSPPFSLGIPSGS